MEITQIILILVSINLAVKLITNRNQFGYWQKRDQDIKLILAYLENNEKINLNISNELIPTLENMLHQIRQDTRS